MTHSRKFFLNLQSDVISLGMSDNKNQYVLDSFDPNEPYLPKKVMRGGSFLCNDSYCSGFRNSMRMKTSPDTSSIHAGFRTVLDAS